ncbi:outer membrane protein with beta-barrel domain [Mucilaginibacter frigoritolerans]|uniref:Outer membrane protein with beta-barrel domain n=1 Tax=Mucilaginibacter frigoritolerans TaxID=652788 RepID=A0A562U299_9SPHI|nr:porin family protein [Mucilaginibacter frigoritolerans]TWI99210.1 outer membrane protein with beta-barrel domain [Mucilaginibacter frigoritolerans]
MNNSLKYLKFWQKKRNELQINDDPQADWFSMQSLLETHLPVNNHPGIKKGSSFKGKIFKMLPKLLITFSAAAMIYTASHIILKKVHQQHTKPNNERLLADSINKDTLNIDSALLEDSLISTNQPKANDSNVSVSGDNKKESTNLLSNNNPNGITTNNKTNSSATISAAKASAQNKSLPDIINKVDNKLASASTANNKIVSDNKLGSSSSAGNKTSTGNKLNVVSATGNKTVLNNLTNNKGNAPLFGTKTNNPNGALSSANKTIPGNKPGWASEKNKTVSGSGLGYSPSSGNKTMAGNKHSAASSINIKSVPGNKLGSSPSSGNKTNMAKKLGAASSANIKTVNSHKLGAASSSNKTTLLNKPGNGLVTSHSGTTHRNKFTGVLTSGNKNTGSNKRKSNLLADNKIIHSNRPGSTLSKSNGAVSGIRLLSASKNNNRGNIHNGYLPSGSSKIEPAIGTQTAGGSDKDEKGTTADNLHNKQQEILTAAPPQTLIDAVSSNRAADSKKSDQKPGLKLLANQSKNNNTKNKKDKSSKNAKPTSQKNLGPSKLDWGVLGGVNSSGSFTSSKQNANFYGSSPVDAYFGLFATYKLNDTWAVGLQTQFFSPQSITTSYTHANESKVDSGQSLQITASRKLYTVNIPINVIYKVSDNFSLMGGPVIGIPIKQISATSTLLPATIKNDSAYYAKVSSILNQTNYEQKLNIGINAGVGFHYKRWLFEASYLKSLTGYAISNTWGTYKSSGSTFQFTIGFQISNPKQ